VLRRDAERFKTEVERERQLRGLYVAAPERFGPFLADWLSRHGQRVRASTLERDAQALRRAEPLSRLLVEEVSAAKVEDLVSEVARTAPRQAQILLRLLKTVLADARARGQRVDEAIAAIRPPRHVERTPRFLLWSEVEELASCCREGRLVAVAALTGLRQGELFALLAHDVDHPSAELVVSKSGDRGRFGPTKNGKSRRVHLTLLASELVIQQLRERTESAAGFLFPSPTGRMWGDDNFRNRVFRPAVKRAGLDGLTFHDLRHTYASLLIAAGVGPMVVAQQMGHADARLVLQRYGHLYPGASAHAAAALDAYLQAATVGQMWDDGAAPTGEEGAIPLDEAWSVPGSNRRPPACKAGALPAELTPRVCPV
jgi:integrase